MCCLGTARTRARHCRRRRRRPSAAPSLTAAVHLRTAARSLSRFELLSRVEQGEREKESQRGGRPPPPPLLFARGSVGKFSQVHRRRRRRRHPRELSACNQLPQWHHPPPPPQGGGGSFYVSAFLPSFYQCECRRRRNKLCFIPIHPNSLPPPLQNLSGDGRVGCRTVVTH